MEKKAWVLLGTDGARPIEDVSFSNYVNCKDCQPSNMEKKAWVLLGTQLDPLRMCHSQTT